MRWDSRLLVRFFACATLSAAAQYDVPPPAETSVASLRKAVTAVSDGSNLPLLLALRQLHDPDLKPLFLQLAQSSTDWQAQVHAVLALAEIDERNRVDAWLVTQVDPQAQEMIVANALDAKLIGSDQFADSGVEIQLHGPTDAVPSRSWLVISES
jgi:HEAT repeat protein